MDPVVAKVVTQTATTGAEATKTPATGDFGSDFKKILDERMIGTNESTKMVQEIFGPKIEQDQMKSMSADSIPLENQSGGGYHSGLYEVLNQVNVRALQMDQMVELATSGQEMTPHQLLAVQAGVYEAGVELDFTAQIVAAGNRVRDTVWQMNIS